MTFLIIITILGGMEDKEVGELWRSWQEIECGVSAAAIICQLIRKLVEERAQNHFRKQTVRDFDEIALRDFGIDPQTFK